MFPKVLVTVPLILLCVAGCRSSRSEASTREVAHEIASPAPAHSFSPRVAAVRDGGVLLTWLEPVNDTLASLRFSAWQNGKWSSPATIVEGQPFSRHPSVAPGVIALSGSNLIAYWSQKPRGEKGPSEEVDVYFSVSTDRGLHWTAPTLANHPGTGQESSYPSAAPIDSNHAALIWLDGGNWAKDKRVTLQSRDVASDGSATAATILDADTCTCCPTALAQTKSGLVAAYRGHTPENIRDISLLRNVSGNWSAPQVPYADHWHFAGCPVNGPQLDVDGSTIALIWFTAPQEKGQVKLAFSQDGGVNFGPPLVVAENNVTGRSQIVLLPNRSALAFWLDSASGTTRLTSRRVRDYEKLDTPFEVTHGPGLGYPHAVRAGNDVFVTWAEESPVSGIHIAIVK